MGVIAGAREVYFLDTHVIQGAHRMIQASLFLDTHVSQGAHRMIQGSLLSYYDLLSQYRKVQLRG